MTTNNEAFKQSLLDYGKIFIWTADLENTCDYFNRPWLDFTGRTFKQELNDGWLEGIHKEDLNKFIEAFVGSSKKKEEFRIEYRLRNHSGEYRWVVSFCSPRFTEDGEFIGYIGQSIDITEGRNLMNSTLEAKEKAEKSNHLKTSFLNNMSHEVRTQLNGIAGFGSLLAEPNITEEERITYFSLLQSSSNRLVNTISDFMNISQLVSGNLSVHPSLQQTKSIIDFSKTKFAELLGLKALVLKIETPDGDENLTFNTDAELVKIVIHHLLDNAIKFTDKGEVVLGFTVNEKNIEFFVRDTGSGVEREIQIDLFDLFTQRTISESQVILGKGNGLYIVKGILNLLKGNIRLESSMGKGSTFYFTLPFKKEANQALNETLLSGISNGNELPIVLAVDDEETNSIYIEAVLRKYASKIIKAYNGKEAVDICRKNPDISIVLMDIKMPIMNGLEATREIKSFRKNLPIVAVTAYALAEDEKIALDAGCDDYLAKPFTYARLIEKVKKFTS